MKYFWKRKKSEVWLNGYYFSQSVFASMRKKTWFIEFWCRVFSTYPSLEVIYLHKLYLMTGRSHWSLCSSCTLGTLDKKIKYSLNYLAVVYELKYKPHWFALYYLACQNWLKNDCECNYRSSVATNVTNWARIAITTLKYQRYNTISNFATWITTHVFLYIWSLTACGKVTNEKTSAKYVFLETQVKEL